MAGDTTPNLQLPYILAAQSQKHVTHNEAIRALDAIVQLAALDRGLSFKTTMGNVLTLTPPLTITAEEMLRALDMVAEAIEDARAATR